MKQKSLILLVSAIALATGVALLARALMRPPPPVTVIKEVEVPAAPPREVLAAGRTLQPGDFIDAAALAWRKQPGDAIQAIHFAAAAEGERRQLERELYGATLRRPLAEGEAFTRDLLVHAGEPGFLAAVLKPGMRAVSIPTSAVSSNAGLVSAGDWVDVILSLERGADAPADASASPYAALASQTILRRVRVLALNSNTASIAPAAAVTTLAEGEQAARGARNNRSASPQRVAYESITLEVTPAAAEQLAVAREIGTLQVALRSVRQEEEDLAAADATAPTRSVTRLNDTTAIFDRPRSGGGAPLTVKTYHGAQQGAQTFGGTK